MVPAISLAYEEKEADIMDRPPRNSATDRLVNRKLISFAYLQIGVMQALAGFFTYMVVLNDYGYAPWTLMNNGLAWEEHSLMCTVKADGTPGKCGYGCKDLKGAEYCKGGCKIPDAGNMDPFLESTSAGYRGSGFCNINCEWLSDAKYADRLATMSTGEQQSLTDLCAVDETYGFAGRKEVADVNQAEEGAFYWWDGQPQLYPNKKYQEEALAYAQTAYFISIIVVQWADLLIAKTRKLSIFEQGMSNQFLNFGLLFETVLGATLCYTKPFNSVFNTRPLHILHWCPGIPWSILIFVYDETRKFYMRKHKDGWLDRYTYW